MAITSGSMLTSTATATATAAGYPGWDPGDRFLLPIREALQPFDLGELRLQDLVLRVARELVADSVRPRGDERESLAANDVREMLDELDVIAGLSPSFNVQRVRFNVEPPRSEVEGESPKVEGPEAQR